MIGTSTTTIRKRMSNDSKKPAMNRKSFSDRLHETDPDEILVATGQATGNQNNITIELYVYERSGFEDMLSDDDYPAVIKSSQKGIHLTYQEGMVKNLMSDEIPTFFSYFPVDYDDGPFDVAKIYKRGDKLECQFYTESLSIVFKHTLRSSDFTPEEKQQINKYRKSTAWKASLSIDPELTYIQVPDMKSDLLKQAKVEEDSNEPKPLF